MAAVQPARGAPGGAPSRKGLTLWPWPWPPPPSSSFFSLMRCFCAGGQQAGGAMSRAGGGGSRRCQRSHALPRGRARSPARLGAAGRPAGAAQRAHLQVAGHILTRQPLHSHLLQGGAGAAGHSARPSARRPAPQGRGRGGEQGGRQREARHRGASAAQRQRQASASSAHPHDGFGERLVHAPHFVKRLHEAAVQRRRPDEPAGRSTRTGPPGERRAPELLRVPAWAAAPRAGPTPKQRHRPWEEPARPTWAFS